MRSYKKFVAILCLFLCAPLAFGEDDMEGKKVDFQGQIEGVDLNSRQLVVNDWVYRLALDLKVHGNGGLETDFALREGRRVKFEVNSTTINHGSPVITDIWLVED